MGMHICNMYSTVASTMTAQKIYVCTPKLYVIRKISTSTVTTAFMRTSTCEYQKGLGANNKNDSSTKDWYITYQANTTINNKYGRITEANAHELPKLNALKTKKEQGIFLLGELISPFT